jgi:hypothetical protein
MAYQNPFVLKFSILLIVMFVFESRETTATLFGKVTVTIINNVTLGQTPTTINVHCKSKDDDLGFHTLKFGENYKFSFRRTLILYKDTLFFCSVTWPGDSKLHYIDIFDEKYDDCNNCTWKINKHWGCKYYTETKSFSKCRHWNKS